MNEEVSDLLLLLEMKVYSVISSVEAEVSKYDLAINLVILDPDSDLDTEDDVCGVSHDF